MSKDLISVLYRLHGLKQHHALLGIRAEDTNLAFHAADVHRLQIDAANQLLAQQIFRSLQLGQLG